MMIEWEDRGEEERKLLLRYLDHIKQQPPYTPPPAAPKTNWFWRLLGRVYLAYLRWRYRKKQ
jgi:hypothetical protein